MILTPFLKTRRKRKNREKRKREKARVRKRKIKENHIFRTLDDIKALN